MGLEIKEYCINKEAGSAGGMGSIREMDINVNNEAGRVSR